MTELRELLDPHHTLPAVRLDTVRDYDFGYLLRDQMNIVVEDEVIGKLDLVSEIHNTERFAHFDGVEIDQSMRGRGIGLATYALAIEISHARNFDFQTQNYELTEHSKKVWERLADKGVAQVVEPFTPSPRFDDRFVGKYRVPVLR
ncbi:MAG: GNAT family N-acetyltransferase [Candidatus Microsaccharimonas sp.]